MAARYHAGSAGCATWDQRFRSTRRDEARLFGNPPRPRPTSPAPGPASRVPRARHPIRFHFSARRDHEGHSDAHSAPPLSNLLMQGPGPLARMVRRARVPAHRTDRRRRPSSYPSCGRCSRRFAEPPLSGRIPKARSGARASSLSIHLRSMQRAATAGSTNASRSSTRSASAGRAKEAGDRSIDQAGFARHESRSKSSPPSVVATLDYRATAHVRDGKGDPFAHSDIVGNDALRGSLLDPGAEMKVAVPNATRSCSSAC